MALPEVIRTERLTLLALTEDQLRSYLTGVMGPSSPVGSISREVLTPILERAVKMKLEMLPGLVGDDQLWITYWLIRVPPADFGAGLIGYKGPPDHVGEVEIGYGIDSAYRSQGYTTEALLGMVEWAFSDPHCQRILAPETLRSNPASNRVLQKGGFEVYGEDAQSISWRLDRSRWEER